MQAPSHELCPRNNGRLGRRFAIGDFSDWKQGMVFVDELIESGTDGSSIGLLGSAEKLRPLGEARNGKLGPLRKLSEAHVACIGEEVFRLLSKGSCDGKPTPSDLREALERWLLPSHARRLWTAVADGRLLVWVAVGSTEQECNVCLGLLKSSGRTVQIHDFGAA